MKMGFLFTSREKGKDLAIKNSWLRLDLCCTSKSRASGRDFTPPRSSLFWKIKKVCCDYFQTGDIKSLFSLDLSAQTYLQLHSIFMSESIIIFLREWRKFRAGRKVRKKSCKLFIFSLLSPLRACRQFAVWWTLYRIFLLAFICFCYDCRLLSNS